MNELTFTKEELDFLKENNINHDAPPGIIHVRLEKINQRDNKLLYSLMNKTKEAYNNADMDNMVRTIWDTLAWDIEEEKIEQFYPLVHIDKTGYEIGDVGNYYGGLSIRFISKPQWSIKDWDGCYWEDIPFSLFKNLLAFEIKRREDIR